VHVATMTGRESGALSAPLAVEDLTLLLFGQAAFQYLHAGSALGVFDALAATRGVGLTTKELARCTGLAPHPLRCLLFGLTSLRLIVRIDGRYTNAQLVDEWIASGEWTVVRDTIALHADIVYVGEADFVDSLREDTNVGLRRIPGAGPDLYHRVAEHPRMQQVFYRYMRSWSEMALRLLLQRVAFSRWRRIVDVGGGDATTAIAIARQAPDATVTLIDLPGNGSVAKRRIEAEGLTHRIDVLEQDMFKDPFPQGVDCVLFMHQLVIWPLETIHELLQKAYRALNPGGAVVICSSISSDTGDGPVMAALDSVYFVSIPATRGLIYSWTDYQQALEATGFRDIERHPCNNWTPHGAIVAAKPHRPEASRADAMRDAN
jgi:L-tyrosine C(3)-methyltransferase